MAPGFRGTARETDRRLEREAWPTSVAIFAIKPVTAPPVLPVLSGRNQVSPTPSNANRPPNREHRCAQKYHAIMATAWLIGAQPEPVRALARRVARVCELGDRPAGRSHKALSNSHRSMVSVAVVNPKPSFAGRETSVVCEPFGSGAAQRPKVARLDSRRNGSVYNFRINSFEN